MRRENLGSSVQSIFFSAATPIRKNSSTRHHVRNFHGKSVGPFMRVYPNTSFFRNHQYNGWGPQLQPFSEAIRGRLQSYPAILGPTPFGMKTSISSSTHVDSISNTYTPSAIQLKKKLALLILSDQGHFFTYGYISHSHLVLNNQSRNVPLPKN